MQQSDTILKRIQGKLQLLVKKYQQLLKDTDRQSQQISTLRTQLENAEAKNKELQEQVYILKAATNTLSDADKKRFEQNINHYIKEIDKCMAYLNE